MPDNIKDTAVYKILIRVVAPIVLLAAYLLFGMAFSAHTPVYNPYGSGAGGEIHYEKAKVVSIKEQNITTATFPGLFTGRQLVTVLLESGQYTGKKFEMDNALNYDMNYILHKGQSIVVSVNTSTGSKKVVDVYMYAPDRSWPLIILIGLFVAALCFVGGWRGFRSILGIIFTLVSVALYFIPLLYQGVSPIIATMLLVAVTTGVTLFLIGGFTKKSATAILGTLAGVVISVIIMLIFSSVMQVSGYTSSDTDALLNIAGQCKLQVKDLLFAGIIISSLGAVMDIAISVVTSVNELILNKPDATFRELFRSGMNMGRDMMGTMVNTLIFAFVGEAVFSFVLMYSYQVQFRQLLNSSSIVIDILQAVCGSFAVILTVPMVSAIAAGWRRKQDAAS